MIDLHTHHARCGHAIGELREYVEAAISCGLQTIGLTPHSPFFAEEVDQYLPHVAMARSEFPRYVAEASQLKDEYRSVIDVRVGVEADFLEPSYAVYRKALSREPLDYIIGSVHVVGEVDVFNERRWHGLTQDEIRAEKDKYCRLVALSAKLGNYDVLGHIDAIKGSLPTLAEVETPAVDAMLAAIAAADVVIEVNTSGKTKPCGGWYPAEDVLERAFHFGVKVTYGSDAHEPSRVGDEVEAVRTLLREVGYSEWFVFERRVRVPISI